MRNSKISNRKFVSILAVILVFLVLASARANALINIVSTYIDMLGNNIYNVGDMNATGTINTSGSFNGNVNAINFTINNTFNVPIKSISENYSVGNSDYILQINAASANITITLPDATLVPGRVYKFKRDDNRTTNYIIINATGSQTIMGWPNTTIDCTYDSIELVSDGSSDWFSIHTPKPDISYFRMVGTSGNGRWYTSPNTGTALSTATLVASTIYATPFLVPKTIKIDMLGIAVTTAGGNNCRLAIYDDLNVYPSRLVIDAENVASNAISIRNVTIGQTLVGNGMYWLVVSCDGAAVLRGFAVASMIPMLGNSNAFGTAWGFQWRIPTATSGYTCCNAYPGMFPQGATVATAAPLPAVFARLSL
jgi:hypothetical protein